MSISYQITRLNNAKAAIKQAISNKGVEVSDEAKLDEYPALIDSIEVGGGSDDFLAIRTMNGVDMSYLFYSYQGEDLDLSGWDTSNVNHMNSMFYGCTNLYELDLSNFNTSNVYNIDEMFTGCYNLETLNISNFSINCNINSILYGCERLKELRLDNCNNDTIRQIIESYEFPTGEVDGDTRKMYVNPDNIDGLEAPEGWIFVDSDGNEIVFGPKLYVPYEFQNKIELTEVTTMVNESHTDLSKMFQYCTNLAIVDTSDWDTYNVYDMSYMFDVCENLPYLDLYKFITYNVENMTNMFYGCTDLLYLDISNFTVGENCRLSKDPGSGMFWDCTSLLDLRLDNCEPDTINRIINSNGFRVNPNNVIEDLPRVVYVREENKHNLTLSDGCVFGYIEDPVYITNKDSAKVEYIDRRGIVNVIVDTQADFDRYGDNNLERLFENCSDLRLINGIEQWNTTGIENMSHMFAGCSNLVSLNLSSFDISNAREINNMFDGCKNLRYLDISNFIMGRESYYYNTTDMFNRCNNLRHLRLDNCDRNTIEKIIRDCNLPTGDIYGEKRKMYVNPDNIDRLEAPDGWEFVYLVGSKKEEE